MSRKLRIVCLDAKTLGDDLDLSVFNQFGEFVSYQTTNSNETVSRLKDADIVITNKVLITKEVIANTNLKLICVSATGVNNIDLEAAKSSDIPVKNVKGYSTNSVTQQTFANLFALINQIPYYNDYVLNGSWSKNDIFTHLERNFFEISGKTFGIIGLGEIGKNIARIAVAFGADVIYYSTSGKNDNRDFKQVSLEELLKNSDIISIHSPLNEKTLNLISQKEIALMKNGAILMNYGRGGIVDEEAVAKAIDEKDLKFASDVFVDEPIKNDNPLLNVKNRQNLILTPHIAWGSVEARKRLLNLIVENIKDFCKKI